MHKPRLIIVDDNLIFRQSLDFVISVHNNAQVIGKISTGKELIELLPQLKPDLILIDIDIPDLNAVELIKKVLELSPDIEIIAFTMFRHEGYIRELIEIGVRKFILKSKVLSDLAYDIHKIRICTNDAYFNTQIMSIVDRQHLEFLQLKYENIWLKNNMKSDSLKISSVIPIPNRTEYENLN